MTECIALFRGINVGKAKRAGMAELRQVFEGLGYSDVRTLLNSGNVVFHAGSAKVKTAEVAARVEEAFLGRFGFSSRTTVLTARELDEVVGGHVLQDVADDPSRYLVAFVSDAKVLDGVRPLLGQDWGADALHVGTRAAYLWCAGGILESKRLQSFSKATGESATTRNWATVLKLQAAARPSGGRKRS
ncbi:MAG: DUF1697 domain-containing protein [Isosphaeraceae bacterium]